MSARRAIWEVARRELAERWRSRAMRASFAILLVLVTASAVIATVADNRTPTDDFGVVGTRAVALAPALRLADQADGRRARVHRLPDRAAAAEALRNGDVDVAIVGSRLMVQQSRSSASVRAAQRALATQSALTRLQAAGLTPQQALAALAPRPVPVDVLDRRARDRERDTGMLWIGVLILFATLVVYGQSVASSVTQEKSSRVIELLLTSLSPRRLLAGKVVGVGTLGVVQLAAVCAAGLLSARIAGGQGLPPGAAETVALVVGWFILGFAFYSVAYAALGALVSRQEDLEATTAPVNVLIVAAYFGAMAAIADPNGTWAQIAAFLPPLSPMIVPTRVVLGDMGALGLIAAIAVELLATFLLIGIAAGIYERSILRIGAPISLRAALAGGRAADERAALHTPAPLLQGTTVAALLAGVVLGTGRPLGIVLLATGLLLTVLASYRRHRPPTPPE
jgi:ABC-2 type transport system permease protein